LSERTSSTGALRQLVFPADRRFPDQDLALRQYATAAERQRRPSVGCSFDPGDVERPASSRRTSSCGRSRPGVDGQLEDELRNCARARGALAQFSSAQRLPRTTGSHSRETLCGARLGADVRGELSGGDLRDWGAWSGQVYAELEYADLAAWRQWIDYPLDIRAGRGGVRL